jgi:NSS family neurotransmitter:Na+ symporter
MLLPNLDAFSWQALPLALKHAFYTLTVGLGVALTYGAYLDERVSVLRASLLVMLADTMLGILAGLMVFPVLLSNELASTSGPALVFQSMPLAFGQMPNGIWFGTLFFLLLVFAAWTSAIALLEPMVAHLTERRGLERAHATSYAGILVWVLGVVALLSFSIWAHMRPLRQWGMFRDSSLFEIFTFLAADVLLPVCGLAIAVFAGWRVSARTAELELGSGAGFKVWRLLIRYVTPAGLLLVLAGRFGLF